MPEKVLTNADLERVVETSDEWIVQRTGMRERRIAAADEFTSDLCVRAAEDLERRSGARLDDVDFVIAATTTPDYSFPGVAAQVQEQLGIPSAGAVDLNATCAGYAYGLIVADGLLASGVSRKVLVVAGETLSKITDYGDRATCILFGDGAGAALVEPASGPGSFLAQHVGADGAGGRHLYRLGLSRRLDEHDADGFIRQSGREVYRWAVKTVSAAVLALLEKADLGADELDWFVPHSANLRITEAICERTGIPMERTLDSCELYGNTASATIPLALSDAERDGKLKDGERVLMYGFGGGLVHAGLVCVWRAAAARA